MRDLDSMRDLHSMRDLDVVSLDAEHQDARAV
jgi:hypothetical protein